MPGAVSCGCHGNRRSIRQAFRKAYSKLTLRSRKKPLSCAPSSTPIAAWSCSSSWLSAVSSEDEWPVSATRIRKASSKSSVSSSGAGSTLATESLTETNSTWEGTQSEIEPKWEASAAQVAQPCICNFPAHGTFDPHIPIRSDLAHLMGEYQEALLHARSICGLWTTMMQRSQSLDPQMQHIGLPRYKRAIMNRYTVPFGALIEKEDTLLRCWIGTPLGNKYMHADLTGGAYTDRDAEVGVWTGVARMVDFTVPWFCGGRSVRALQLKRISAEFGTAFETRVVLPDEAEGKILLFNLALYPLDPTKPAIHVDRILKFVKPL